MNKLSLIAVAVLLSACGTTDVYEKRAQSEYDRNAKEAERAVSQAPAWMTKLPESENAVYANGTAISRDMSMAEEKAKLIALAKICVAAGGTVDQQSRVYQMDTENSSSEQSETAIQSRCQAVDVTGTEIREVKRVASGDRFRVYVLVALPTGAANPLAKQKEQRALRTQTEARAAKTFESFNR